MRVNWKQADQIGVGRPQFSDNSAKLTYLLHWNIMLQILALSFPQVKDIVNRFS